MQAAASQLAGSAGPCARPCAARRASTSIAAPGRRASQQQERQRRRSVVAAAAAAAATAQTFRTAADLPGALRNSTAVLHTGDGAAVYVLGISHVSKESCQQIEQLISLVKPDTVVLELCKDRTMLLVDPDAPQPQAWWAPRCAIAGLPTGGAAAGWPPADTLEALLKCRGCAPVSASDIEDGAVALLSTGLFASVRVQPQQPGGAAAPAFVLRPGAGLDTVAPLAAIDYAVAPRQLAPIAELTARAEGGVQPPTDEALAAATAAAKGAPSGVGGYLAARAALLQGLPADVDVSFERVEAGKPTAVLRPLAPGEQRSLTGLEGTAAGGAGHGIEAYRRQAPPQQQRRPPAAQQPGGVQLGAASKQPAAGGSSKAIAAPSASQLTELQPWSREQLAAGAAAAGGSAPGSGGNALSAWLTQTYSKYQGAAGRTVGIPPGEAWRVALRAALASGATQVLLGDLPADTTGRRLADAILASSAPLLVGSLAASATSAVVLSQGLLDSDAPANPLAVAALSAVPLAAALAPLVAPLLEVAAFSRKSAREIEDIVRLTEPVQAASPDAPIVKLWGEDALLAWPGALQPVIHARDAYMTKACAAAASGRPQGLTPAFVLTAAGGGGDAAAVLQYAMPVGGAPGACPHGAGAGQYQPQPGPRTVVAVVGTAHVRGMIREWPAAQADPSIAPLL